MQTLIIILIVVMIINEIIAIGVYFKSNLDKQQHLSLQETFKNTQADFIAQKQRYEKIIDEYKEIIRNMTYKCDKQDICINGYIKGTDTDGGVIGEKGEQCEQKSADKSKFHEGDWIIHQGTENIYQVIARIDNQYQLKYGDNYTIQKCTDVDRCARLWNIKDAKYGDVLCYKDEVFLYKHDIKDWKETCFGGVVYRCCYDGKRFITDSFYSLTEQDKIDIHPATKEQRDILFSKMAEAGFEWDSVNKELRMFEPKFNFKVGQWIVATGKCVYLIAKIDGFNVTLVDTIGNEYVFDVSSLADAHLWTIQDAKDGDVLSSEDKIFLYNGKFDLRGRVCAYCGIYKTYDGLRFTECAIGNYFTYKEPYPATKEQRDALMKAMADADYTFDFEKKELKKIEEEYNGEDYGIDSLFHAQRILEKTLGKVDGYQSDDGILSHKCAITAIKKLCEQEPVWSENDEHHWMLRIVQHNKEQTSQKQ